MVGMNTSPAARVQPATPTMGDIGKPKRRIEVVPTTKPVLPAPQPTRRPTPAVEPSTPSRPAREPVPA